MVGTLIARNVGERNLAILHSNDVIATSNAEAFASEWESNGKVVVSIAFEYNEFGFESALNMLPQEGVDIVYVANSSPANPAQFLPTLMERFSTGVVAYNGTMSTALTPGSFGNDSSRSFFVAPIEPQMLVEAQGVVAALEEAGTSADFYALSGYVAIQALSAAIAGTREIQPSANANWMKENSFDSIIGNVNFRSNGDIETAPIALYGWTDDVLRLVDASKQANCVPTSPTWNR